MPEAVDPAQIRIARLFPTPLASLEHPDHRRLNLLLRETILQRAAAHPGVRHSNQGGWQSADDFVDWSGEAGAELAAFGRNFATQLSAVASPQHGLIEPQLAWTVNAWANVNRKGDDNAPHGHPGSYWSGVYWVDDGREPAAAAGLATKAAGRAGGADGSGGSGGSGSSGDTDVPDSTGGDLVFVDPRGVMPTLLAPYLRMRIEGCLSAGLDHAVKPSSGTFVMFPSWLLHSVSRYHGARPRISVAFNFGP